MRSLHRLQTDFHVPFQQRKAPQEYAARLGRSESRARTCVQPVNEPVALPLSYFRAVSRMRLSQLVVKSHSLSLCAESEAVLVAINANCAVFVIQWNRPFP